MKQIFNLDHVLPGMTTSVNERELKFYVKTVGKKGRHRDIAVEKGVIHKKGK